MARKKNPLPKNSPHRIIADAMKEAFVSSGLAKSSQVFVFRDNEYNFFGINVNSPHVKGYIRVHPEYDGNHQVLDFLSGYKFTFTYKDDSKEIESDLYPSYLTSDNQTKKQMATAARKRVHEITKLLFSPPARKNPAGASATFIAFGLGFLLGK